jgi:hypothetical protein
MARRVVSGIFMALLVSLGILGQAGTAGAATTTRLLLSQSAAFSLLGHSCGGIQEQVYATGFAPNGYPAGDVYMQTRCGGSGRGGGYKTTTYSAWASATWTWYGATRSYARLQTTPEGLSTTFSAEDSYADRIYNSGTAAYIETTSPPIMAPAPPTGITAAAFRAGEEGEGPQEFQVSWLPAQETAGLITSSTITATPVGSAAPVLTATVSGSQTSGRIGTLVPHTTYKITVTNTDAEGTSQPSAPDEVSSLSFEEEALLSPIVITEAPTEVTHTSASLNAAVNPQGEELGVCRFEYGTSESYGSSVACSSVPSEAETPVLVSAPVTGLAPETTYHFRIVAGSEGGTSYGSDEIFTTLGALPPTASISSPLAGGVYSPGQVVPTVFSCVEGEGAPGIASCLDSNGASGSSGTLDTSTVGPHTYTVTAISEDGQQAEAEISYVVAEPPTASISSPVTGGVYLLGEVIDTSFSCSEGTEGPGIESCLDSHAGSGTSGTLDTSTAGAHTYTVVATSTDGQTGKASISYTVVKARCTINSGTFTLSPGLTSTASVQSMKIKGTLTGCTGEPFTGVNYTATLKTAAAVSCSVLTGAPETATGAAAYKWAPKAKPSTGTLSMLLTEAPGSALSGELALGSYSPLTFSGAATESYTGGATCGQPVGKKPAKPVKKGTFAGSVLSFG